MLVNWLLTSLCRLDDDLTHHLSAEHKMKPSDLKTAEHFILKFKQTSFNEFNPDQGSYLEILFLFPLQPNWSRSVTASRSCRLAVWSKTTRWVGLHLVTCRCCVFFCSPVLTCCLTCVSSGGHRHPGGTHHSLRGLRSVDGRRCFQQDLKANGTFNKKHFTWKHLALCHDLVPPAGHTKL